MLSAHLYSFQRYYSGFLALTAMIALGMAFWIYVGERPANAVPAFFVDFNIADRVEPMFGAAAGSLPTFGHVFGLSILTALMLSPSRRAAFLACTSWALINICFEVGQHEALAKSAAALLPSSATFRAYFISGTFDVLDVFAAAVGAVAAYILLSNRSHSNE